MSWKSIEAQLNQEWQSSWWGDVDGLYQISQGKRLRWKRTRDLVNTLRSNKPLNDLKTQIVQDSMNNYAALLDYVQKRRKSFERLNSERDYSSMPTHRALSQILQDVTTRSQDLSQCSLCSDIDIKSLLKFLNQLETVANYCHNIRYKTANLPCDFEWDLS